MDQPIFSDEEKIQNLIELTFKKAEKESNEASAYGLTNYLSQKVEEDFNYRISERNATRYYNGYVLKDKDERTIPGRETLNNLSRYLGYFDFIDFVREGKHEIVRRRLYGMLRAGTILSTIFLISAIFFISKYYKKNCMIWVEDHYEKIRCSGLNFEIKLNEVVLENFRKVEVCDTTTFFKNGEPIIHYLKYKNQIEFFTYHGEHPIYQGKFLDPITETIINGHVKPCDSIIRQ